MRRIRSGHEQGKGGTFRTEPARHTVRMNLGGGRATEAVGTCIWITFCYVSAVNVASMRIIWTNTTRSISFYHSDSTRAIIRRSIAVLLVCCYAMLCLYTIMIDTRNSRNDALLFLFMKMGVIRSVYDHVKGVIDAIILIGLLFLGPIVQHVSTRALNIYHRR